MTAGEHQLETIIREGIHLFFIVGKFQHGDFAFPIGGAAQTVNGATFGDGRQPRAGVARNAVNFPAFQRIDQRILKRVFR
jgi:hypothetical protein